MDAPIDIKNITDKTSNIFKDGWSNYFTLERSFGAEEFENVRASFAWKSDILSVIFYADYKTNCDIIPYSCRLVEEELEKRLEIVTMLEAASGFNIDRFLEKTYLKKQLHHIDDYLEIIDVLDELITGELTAVQRVQLWNIRQNIIDYWRGSDLEARYFRMKYRRLNIVETP